MDLIKVIVAAMVLVLHLGAAQGQTAGSDLFRESMQNQLEELDLEQLLSFTDLVEAEYHAFLPDLSWRGLLSGGSGAFGLTQFLMLLFRNFLREFHLNMHLLRQLIVVGILAALLQRLSSSFGSETVVDLAFGVCFLVSAYLALQSFRTVLRTATTGVDQMVSFMYSLLPLLSALLLAVGGITSAAIFHPLLWALLGCVAGLVQYLLFPLILFGAAFGFAAQFTTELPLSRLAALFRQGAVILLGAFFVVFTGFMAVRGAFAPVVDGISFRTAKYLTKTLIPVAGGMFADALEVVVGGSLLIKNGVGVFGLVLVAVLVVTPLLKVGAMIVVYKLVGALLEPICDLRLVRALGSMESSLTLVFVSLGTVALMFLLTIAIVVGIGNLAVFMR